MNKIVENDISSIINSSCVNWDKFTDKTILITGATGFIGSFLINSLLSYSDEHSTNIKILAVVRNEDRAKKMFEHYYSNNQIAFIAQDVCKEIDSDMKADYIIHCASNAAPKEYSSDPVGTINTNYMGTLNLLNYAKRVNASKFLYVSTIEVYGATTVDTITENDFGYINSSNTRSCYPLSKKMSENLCFCYASQFDIDVTVGRLSYIFGPGMKANDSKIVAIFPKQIAKGENIVMKSKGEQLRSYTYISDAIVGLLTILSKGESGKAYNIASDKCKTTIRNIAETLVSLYPEKELKVIFDLPNESETKAFSFINNAVLDSSELKALNWHSEMDLKTGLKNVVEEQTLLGANNDE